MSCHLGYYKFLLLFSLSVVSYSFVTPSTIVHQAPGSMEFPRQEYWSGLPFPSPGESSWPRHHLSCLLHCRKILYHWPHEKPSVQHSYSHVSNSLWPHGLQHARLPCPSPTHGACSNSCPLSQWCHPTIWYSVIPFFSCLQSFPALGSYPMN